MEYRVHYLYVICYLLNIYIALGGQPQYRHFFLILELSVFFNTNNMICKYIYYSEVWRWTLKKTKNYFSWKLYFILPDIWRFIPFRWTGNLSQLENCLGPLWFWLILSKAWAYFNLLKRLNLEHLQLLWFFFLSVLSIISCVIVFFIFLFFNLLYYIFWVRLVYHIIWKGIYHSGRLSKP